ncbi:hypothetical protein K5X82_14940 [Halosquirtibacter xylanolyticus]|uniref:hypothetical protein n=1 Tax=Halosquirtibacter xylanolyticus TaxID=3374599 RepID=UPI00374A4180|nr:hypothetical protein K5X82_14940 [Prolixibacteraceae bacterium]
MKFTFQHYILLLMIFISTDGYGITSKKDKAKATSIVGSVIGQTEEVNTTTTVSVTERGILSDNYKKRKRRTYKTLTSKKKKPQDMFYVGLAGVILAPKTNLLCEGRGVSFSMGSIQSNVDIDFSTDIMGGLTKYDIMSYITQYETEEFKAGTEYLYINYSTGIGYIMRFGNSSFTFTGRLGYSRFNIDKYILSKTIDLTPCGKLNLCLYNQTKRYNKKSVFRINLMAEVGYAVTMIKLDGNTGNSGGYIKMGISVPFARD